MVLYHGSKSGVVGRVRPISRDGTDFGRGFYMGTNKLQAWNIALHGTNPSFYEADVNLDGLRTLELKGVSWLIFIIYHRQPNILPDNTLLKCSCELLSSSYDVIQGTIADDSISTALTNCCKNMITMQTCIKAVQLYDLGCQYAFITEKACERIKLQKINDVDIHAVKSFIGTSSERRVDYEEFVVNRFRTPGILLKEFIEEHKNHVLLSSEVELDID